MRTRRTWAVVALTVLATAGIATSASAHGNCSDSNQRFCAFNNSGYSGELTYFVPAAGGGPYSVASNQTTSVANHHQSLSVCGVESAGWPDQTVLNVGATQHISTLATGVNNVIDHFYTC